MDGQTVKDLIRKERVYQWEIAQRLDISEYTLLRWLRGNLTIDQERKIVDAINEVVSERHME